MPIYEYTCDSCGAAFEKIVRMGGGDDVDCPKCGAYAVTRQLSAFAFKSGGRFTSSSKSAGCSGCSSSGSCTGSCH